MGLSIPDSPRSTDTNTLVQATLEVVGIALGTEFPIPTLAARRNAIHIPRLEITPFMNLHAENSNVDPEPGQNTIGTSTEEDDIDPLQDAKEDDDEDGPPRLQSLARGGKQKEFHIAVLIINCFYYSHCAKSSCLGPRCPAIEVVSVLRRTQDSFRSTAALPSTLPPLPKNSHCTHFRSE